MYTVEYICMLYIRQQGYRFNPRSDVIILMDGCLLNEALGFLE